jgi:hypothetical protein
MMPGHEAGQLPTTNHQPRPLGQEEKMRYEIDDNEVLDHQTGLIWQRAIAENLTFDQAFECAERVARETGLAWRLPTKDELAGLVDKSRHFPASRFPDMPSGWFWSSSEWGWGDTDSAWLVDFAVGDAADGRQCNCYAVRLVRDREPDPVQQAIWFQ